MRVFVTGATGFVGSAVVQELLKAGHHVLGLARSEESARSLAATGAEVHRGSLDDTESLKSGAAKADGVIHTAFIHDFSNFAAACATDRAAITAMAEVIKGTGAHMVITSGSALLPSGRLGTEEDALNQHGSHPRVESENLADALVQQGCSISVMRLPPSVHDKGDHGFVPVLINIAKEKGAAAYIGEGHNHWPAVHRLDAARAYRLALEKGTAGARYHAVADQGIPTREIAAVISEQLHVPLISVAPEKVSEHFGWIGYFFSLDVMTSSKLTRERLNWEPVHADLISDMKAVYF